MPYPKLTSDNLHKLYTLAAFISRDYYELSHDKVRWQRDDFMKRAKKTLDELDWDDEPVYPGSDVQDAF